MIIHLTIERPTKGRFANVSHNIVRLLGEIFLKLQESNFLLYGQHGISPPPKSTQIGYFP
eukprot:COSAG01_NODE_5828_length_4007_cov_15.721597_3_plen_60_part_00